MTYGPARASWGPMNQVPGPGGRRDNTYLNRRSLGQGWSVDTSV